jgi:hypothetical protein
MTRKQYIASAVAAAGLFILLYIVPPITEAVPLVGAALGAVMLAIITTAVFKGGLTDVSGE